MNKAELYTTVREMIDRTDISDSTLDNALRLVEENMARELRPIILEKYVELGVNDNLLQLPSDLLELKLVVRADNTPLYGRQDPSTVLNEYNESNRDATAFARMAGNLVFNGDITDSVMLYYHQTPPSLLSDSADEVSQAERLLQYSPNFYQYGVAYHVSVRYNHEQKDEYRNLYTQAAGAIQSHTDTSNESGGTLIQEGVTYAA